MDIRMSSLGAEQLNFTRIVDLLKSVKSSSLENGNKPTDLSLWASPRTFGSTLLYNPKYVDIK